MEKVEKSDIAKEIEKNAASFEKDKRFQELEKFYQNMKERGLVKKSEYTLPPYGTSGCFNRTNPINK